MTLPDDTTLADILRSTSVIAVVGMSPNPLRPSHYVAEFLQQMGYRIIPVNPGQAGGTILGQTVYSDLAAIPSGAGVDMVDIFRQSDAVPAIVDAALAHLPDLRTVWMQIGVIHEAAAAKARAAGKQVVMDRCPKIEYPRLIGTARRPSAGW
jgi:predicted CoA-binding protein